ncbi:MAG: hypothetical protein M3Z09_16340 [Acidobacteriota bacterium]|nr:hypothetical protein [Acidobacteriota bacterium]
MRNLFTIAIPHGIAFLLPMCLFSGTLLADSVLRPGTPVLDRPTVTALGVQLPLSGDDNFNSSVTVRYRVSGTTAWKAALPLFRVHPETVANWNIAPQFAGSIFDLRPSTSYDIELHATDPDGLDQVLTLSGATRGVPKDPVNPVIRNVVDASSLKYALWAAQPGDVISLANGTYTGQFQITTAGTPENPIVIRGASEDGTILDGANCVPCNGFEVYGAGYVHLERMTIRNAEQGIRFQTSGAVGNVIRHVHIQNAVVGITGRNDQYDFYIADNIVEGSLRWPNVNSDDGGISASKTGIAVFGSGHVVTHNRISGFGDAMRTEQDGARANDFFGNDILFTYDNGLELDGSEGNVRCVRNRFTNTFLPLSVQPIHGGPAYMLRNVAVNIVSEQMKFHALGGVPPEEPSGVLAYHNTFVSTSKLALQMLTSATSHYFEIENNLFVAQPSSGQLVADWEGPIDHGTFDYNGYFPDGAFHFNTPSLGFYVLAPNFAALQSIGMEQRGRIVNGPIFANGMTAPASYLPLLNPADATLASGSRALDAGRVLPNINDGFPGSAPDLGALELGCPAPSYGPRSDGTDETNEVTGCSGGPALTDFALSVSPASQAVTAGGSAATYTVTVTGAGGFNSTVALGVSGLPAGATGTFAPSSITGSGASTLQITTAPSTAAGNYSITVAATTGSTGHTASAPLTVNAPALPSGTAAFVATDTTTQGNWKSAYGADGYTVVNDSSSAPSYAQVSPAGQLLYTWADSTTDVRGLQRAVSAGRIAGTWFAPSSFTIDINMSDARTHQVSLYCIDWDSGNRTQRVDILDANTGAVLDSRSVASFASGKYLVWNLSGHVRARITQNAGYNAVVSGLFFGTGTAPSASASGSATYAGTDTTTLGNWKSGYGADGYAFAADSAAYPPYAQVAVANQLNYTWSASTMDIRALQKISAADRLASAWYSPGAFTVDINLTDGKTHRVSLYCLDWDSAIRGETIDIVDAKTNAVLDSRPVSSFGNGKYVTWNLSGHVQARITRNTGSNAVISGLFFGGPAL